MDDKAYSKDPVKWNQILFNILDKNMDGYITYDDLEDINNSLSFKIEDKFHKLWNLMNEYLNNPFNINGVENGMVQMNWIKFQSMLDNFNEPILLNLIMATVKYHLNCRIELLKNTNGAFDAKMN